MVLLQEKSQFLHQLPLPGSEWLQEETLGFQLNDSASANLWEETSYSLDWELMRREITTKNSASSL
jgi:hypothetical protein